MPDENLYYISSGTSGPIFILSGGPTSLGISLKCPGRATYKMSWSGHFAFGIEVPQNTNNIMSQSGQFTYETSEVQDILQLKYFVGTCQRTHMGPQPQHITIELDSLWDNFQRRTALFQFCFIVLTSNVFCPEYI